MDTKKLTLIGLLTALAIVVPFAVFFKVIIPPFTATLGSHVPMFISMLLGPQAAIMVGLGSALGFFLTLGPLVAARAFMHVFVGVIGAVMIKRGCSLRRVSILTSPIHGLLEVLVVMPFIGLDVYNLLIITGLGTMLHHGADAAISYIIVNVLEKSKVIFLAKQN